MKSNSQREPSPVLEVNEPVHITTPRRAQLSREVIIDAYLQIAARTNAPVSLSRLGRELDADPTGIYRHFRDKDDLLLSVTDRLQGIILQSLSTSGAWQQRLRELLVVTVSVYSEHPAIAAEAASRTTRQQNEFRIVEMLLGLMREAGLGGEDVVRYYRAVADLLLAYAGTRAMYLLLDEGTRTGDEASWSKEYRAVDPSIFPHIAASAPSLAAFNDDDVLKTLIEVLTQAIEARAATGVSTHSP